MITHTELFNRAAENYDFGGIWAVEDAVEKDLAKSEKEYWDSVQRFNYSNDKNSAFVDMYYAYVRYCKTYSAYVAFLN